MDFVARRAQRVPGVRASSNLIISQSTTNLKGGQPKQIYLVAFDPATGMGGPATVTAGSTSALERELTVILDESAGTSWGRCRWETRLNWAIRR